MDIVSQGISPVNAESFGEADWADYEKWLDGEFETPDPDDAGEFEPPSEADRAWAAGNLNTDWHSPDHAAFDLRPFTMSALEYHVYGPEGGGR